MIGRIQQVLGVILPVDVCNFLGDASKLQHTSNLVITLRIFQKIVCTTQIGRASCRERV